MTIKKYMLENKDDGLPGPDPDPCQNALDPQHRNKHGIFLFISRLAYKSCAQPGGKSSWISVFRIRTWIQVDPYSNRRLDPDPASQV